MIGRISTIRESILAGGQSVISQHTDIDLHETGELAPKIYGIIGKYGKYFTFNNAVEDFTLACSPPYKFKREYASGKTILAHKARIILPAYNITYYPNEGDKVTFDGQDWRIIGIEQLYAKTKISAYLIDIEFTGNSAITQSSIETSLDKRIVPKVVALINKHGISANFNYWTTPPIFDHATNMVIGGIDTYETIKVVQLTGYEQHLVDGKIIRDGDKKTYVAGGSVTFSFFDLIGLSIGSIDWKIIGSYPFYSGNKIALYELQLRR